MLEGRFSILSSSGMIFEPAPYPQLDAPLVNELMFQITP